MKIQMRNSSDILIYTEGGFKLGLGNVYRSISLADALRKKGRKDIRFITSSDDIISEMILKKGYEALCFPKDELLDKIISLDPRVLIVDFLGLDESFARKIKKMSRSKLVIIGNDSKANKYADLVVNAVVGTDFKNRKTLKGKTLYLEGPKYLVLRDEFDKKIGRYSYRGKLEKIMLLFGGTDQANFTCRVFEDLINFDRNIKLKLVLGAGFKYEKELENLLKRYPDSNVSIHKDVSNVSDLMIDSDFVVTSAGTSLFEGFCLGVPILGLFQNDSQKKVFRNFFMTIGYEAVGSIGKFINSTYENIGKYRKGIASIKAGEGKEEIINKISKL